MPEGAVFERFRQIEAGPLDERRLPDFVRTYVEEDACERVLAGLAGLTKEREISPLLAYLAIDRVTKGHHLPTDYPNLVVDYVLGLRPHGRGAIREDDFLRAACLAAFKCVERSLAPREIESTFLRGVFSHEGTMTPFCLDNDEFTELTPAVIVNQLVHCGLLCVNSYQRVQFAYDPIAEYLAAWHAFRHEDRREIAGPLRRRLSEAEKRGSNAGTGLTYALCHVEKALDQRS
ncbi:MAG: hypothetical protein ACYTG0_41055 [Planctomycetota bacterium]